MNSNIFNSKDGKGVSGIDYLAITNLEQLQAAKIRLAHLVELKEQELNANKQAVKEALNPLTYINRFITKLYSMEYLFKYAVKGYDFVKDFFNKHTPDSTSDASHSPVEETAIVEEAPVAEATENPDGK